MPDMNDVVRKYLDKLEGIIDIEHDKRVKEVYKKVFEYQPVDELPYVISDTSEIKDNDWPSYRYNDAFADPAKMLLNELNGIFRHVQAKDYHPLNIRCNYGTVIMPSVLGMTYKLTEASMPWSNHVETREDVQKLIQKGIPDLEQGLGKTCFETAAYYKKMLAPYPKLNKAMNIYHPDMQGPFDIIHLIWGHDLMYAMFDCPEMIHDMMQVVTETYRAYMRKWKKFTGEGNEFTSHWWFYMKGGIMLRNDSPIMISPEQYEEFVKPYDQSLLDEFGGCVHFCGRGTTFIDSMCKSKKLYGLHSSQIHLNDKELLYKSTSENKVVWLSVSKEFLPSVPLKTGVTLYK
ncbi:MAG: hypothetical protein A2231_06485 [Candidatus Firestonebacteria bacterium RIFOXYA2_FULL_40_8]|nr:MAG: hypothetical protein A2231_06485 [Candidatus Firestonebacteria bacterium RIFOXYA2_FULL_40_8]